MKTKIMIAFCFFITGIKAQDSTMYVTGPHGGVLKTTENYKVEFISTFDCVTTYVYDEDCHLIPNKFISGSIMFFYDHEITLHKYLVPVGTDRFIADLPGATYIYCTMDFKINKKTIEVRFENFSGVANKE